MADRRTGWRVGVPVVAVLAGLLCALSATTAAGTDLRSRQNRLADLVASQQRAVTGLQATNTRLRAAADAAGAQVARRDARVAAARAAGDALAPQAGFTSVTGAGLVVRLTDAVPSARTLYAAPDDLLVHQQDIQAVVNALWAGGARAMTLMGQRVIATSAVRCVGNTLLLQGSVYSPPYLVQAVGDPIAMAAALDTAPGVRLYRQYVDAYGLGYVVARTSLTLPPFPAVPALSYATPLAAPTPGAPASPAPTRAAGSPVPSPSGSPG